MDKKTQFNIWYVILAIFGVLFFQNMWIESQQIERLSYSAFEEKLKAGEIQRITHQPQRRGVDDDAVGRAIRLPEHAGEMFATHRFP